MSKRNMKLKVLWIARDSIAAREMGWDIFRCDNYAEIKVFTEHPAGFTEGADDVAVAWIIQQACMGGEIGRVCAKGLIVCSLLNPQRMAGDYAHIVKHGMARA